MVCCCHYQSWTIYWHYLCVNFITLGEGERGGVGGSGGEVREEEEEEKGGGG